MFRWCLAVFLLSRCCPVEWHSQTIGRETRVHAPIESVVHHREANVAETRVRAMVFRPLALDKHCPGALSDDVLSPRGFFVNGGARLAIYI